MAMHGLTFSTMFGKLPNKTIYFLEKLSTITDVYMTGSRYFGNYKNDSDWDFFIRRFPEFKEILTDYGFKRITNITEYKDLLVSDVYRLDDPIKGKIDIQVLDHRNIPIKVKAQNFINKNFSTFEDLFNKLDKEYKSILWNIVIDLIETSHTLNDREIELSNDSLMLLNSDVDNTLIFGDTAPTVDKTNYIIETNSLDPNGIPYSIIVDEDVYNKISDKDIYVHKDYVAKDSAKLNVRIGYSGGIVKLDRLIMGIINEPKTIYCLPINGNWLDLRKENLEVVKSIR